MAEQESDKIQKLKKTTKGSSRETLFRVTIQNQLRSISIADQKANIIIGINTILISIFIATVGLVSNVAQLNFISNLNLSLPLTIMVLTSFSSGTLAFFVVRPASSLWTKKNASRLSFRDYQNCTLDNFKKDINQILESPNKIYDSLTTDLYLYGQTVQRKFRMLRHAYLVFLIGLSLAVLSFLILQFVGPDTL